MTAASAMNVLEAMANRFDRKVVHAPDPNGLPGGYPVLIAESSVNVILPDNLTLQEAIHMNEEGQRLKEYSVHANAGIIDKPNLLAK